jgi:hypothetical protein
MLKDLLLAIHELHSCGIAHGDPHPKHLLSDQPLSVDLKDEATYEDTSEMEISQPLEREDGYYRDRWAPQYLCASQPLSDLTKILETPRMRLTSLGAGTSCTGSRHYTTW